MYGLVNDESFIIFYIHSIVAVIVLNCILLVKNV